MAARIVVVHDDPTFRDLLVASLRASGHEVASFVDTTAAWDALAASERVKVDFGPGKPHGVALARSARSRRPAIRVLFVARPEDEEDAADVGLFLARPVTVPEVAEAVEKMLADPRLGAVV